MNYTTKSYAVLTAPQHKPRVSLFIQGDERCYQCTDGGLIQYGYTQLEAFNNLKALR